MAVRRLPVLRPAASRARNARLAESEVDGTDAPPAPRRARRAIDCGVYVNGHRTASPPSLTDTYRCLDDQPGSMAWIGLQQPDERELASLAAEFGLHELAIEDAILAHQRPKLERYGETLFVVLRPARYLDAPEEIDFAEVHVFVGRDFVVTVAPRAVPRPGGCPPPRREQSRPAATWAGGRAVRDSRPGCGRLRAGGVRPGQRH